MLTRSIMWRGSKPWRGSQFVGPLISQLSCIVRGVNCQIFLRPSDTCRLSDEVRGHRRHPCCVSLCVNGIKLAFDGIIVHPILTAVFLHALFAPRGWHIRQRGTHKEERPAQEKEGRKEERQRGEAAKDQKTQKDCMLCLWILAKMSLLAVVMRLFVRLYRTVM